MEKHTCVKQSQNATHTSSKHGMQQILVTVHTEVWGACDLGRPHRCKMLKALQALQYMPETGAVRI
jgi:hypothetical protein